ncbi:MAG: MFS transporter [Truepera sp.]|nr:MFS transporter [Truepera sp.]
MAVTRDRRRTVLAGGSLTFLLILAHTNNDGFFGMFSALLPTFQARFGLSETGLALLVATLSLSTSVTQPLFGVLADRIGQRLLAGLGTLLCAALLSQIVVVPSVLLLVGVLFVGGLGSAAFHPSGMSLARTAGGERKGMMVGLFGASGALGMALGPVVILYLLARVGPGPTPLLMIPGLLLGLAILVLFPKRATVPRQQRARLFDRDLVAGPVGLLSLAGILRATSFVTFTSAMPLWLVKIQGYAPDSPLIGWTLATFTFSSALGGVLAGALADHFPRRRLTVGAILLALPFLLAIFLFPPGTLAFFGTVALAGLVTNASLPLLILSGQDLAPHALSTASGMLMGLSWGTAGFVYIGIGLLQEILGITDAMILSYLLLLPAAALAFYVLSRHRVAMSR